MSVVLQVPYFVHFVCRVAGTRECTGPTPRRERGEKKIRDALI
jgi:hypothetical protein